MKHVIALFGESDKGSFESAYLCHTIIDLCNNLGHPEKEKNGQGLLLAIQSVMLEYSVIYFRVEEEGFNLNQYLFGLQFLKNNSQIENILAIGLPGVGEKDLIDKTYGICKKLGCFLLFNEKDLYDFMTN